MGEEEMQFSSTRHFNFPTKNKKTESSSSKFHFYYFEGVLEKYL